MTTSNYYQTIARDVLLSRPLLHEEANYMGLKAVTYEEQLNFEIKKLPGEYLPNLLQIVRLFSESVMLKPAEDSFSEGWKEAMAGETRPVSELWDGMNAD